MQWFFVVLQLCYGKCRTGRMKDMFNPLIYIFMYLLSLSLSLSLCKLSKSTNLPCDLNFMAISHKIIHDNNIKGSDSKSTVHQCSPCASLSLEARSHFDPFCLCSWNLHIRYLRKNPPRIQLHDGPVRIQFCVDVSSS